MTAVETEGAGLAFSRSFCISKGFLWGTAFMGTTTGIEWTDATWNPWYGSCPDISIRAAKGGDWDEWPADLRVRQFPYEELA